MTFDEFVKDIQRRTVEAAARNDADGEVAILVLAVAEKFVTFLTGETA